MAAGTIAAQAAAIKAIVQAVPDVGTVFDHQPLPVNDWSKFVAAFTVDLGDGYGRHIRSWTIQYLGETRLEENVAIGATKVKRDISWVVRGHFSLDNNTEDSESKFRDLIEQVADALDTNKSLNGTAIDHDPVDVALPNNGAPIRLGDHLVHYAEITFRSITVETYATT